MQDEIPKLFSEGVAGERLHFFSELDEESFVLGFKIERLKKDFAILLVKRRVFHAVKDKLRAAGEGKIFGAAQHPFAQKIIGDESARFFIGESGEEPVGQLARGPFNADKTRSVFFCKIIDDACDVPLGFLIHMSILDVNDKPFSRAAEDALHLTEFLGKIEREEIFRRLKFEREFFWFRTDREKNVSSAVGPGDRGPGENRRNREGGESKPAPKTSCLPINHNRLSNPIKRLKTFPTPLIFTSK